MSALDHLKDSDLEAAGEGIAGLLLALADANIDPRPHLTKRTWDGLQSVVFAVGQPTPEPGRIDGAPDDPCWRRESRCN